MYSLVTVKLFSVSTSFIVVLFKSNEFIFISFCAQLEVVSSAKLVLVIINNNTIEINLLILFIFYLIFKFFNDVYFIYFYFIIKKIIN